MFRENIFKIVSSASQYFFNSYPKISFFSKLSYSSQSFDEVIQFCYNKSHFQAPTVILLTTDINIPKHLLHRYKSELIFAIINLNSKNVDLMKPHIFDESLSVDYNNISVEAYTRQIGNAITIFCSSSAPSIQSPLPTPSAVSVQSCRSIRLCFYRVPNEQESYSTAEVNAFIHNAYEIWYALNSLIPIEYYRYYSDEATVSNIIDDCYSDSSDVYPNPSTSIIILQSNRNLSDSVFKDFESGFIIGSVSTSKLTADSSRSHVSNPSLSVDYHTALPIDFAMNIKSEIEKRCDSSHFVPSPAPSNSPRNCTLVTFCGYELYKYSYRSYPRDLFDRIRDMENSVASALYVSTGNFGDSYNFKFNSYSFNDVIQRCDKKTTFRSPTVILLTTDVKIPPYLLHEYKTKYIFAIVNLNPGYVNLTKPHIFDPSLSVDFNNIRPNAFAGQLESAITDFCSSAPP